MRVVTSNSVAGQLTGWRVISVYVGLRSHRSERLFLPAQAIYDAGFCRQCSTVFCFVFFIFVVKWDPCTDVPMDKSGGVKRFSVVSNTCLSVPQ